MTLSIDLPDVRPLKGMTDQYLKRLLIASLYNVGKISAGEACRLLEINRREFEELLPEFGFSILNDSEESIDIELNA